MIDLGGLVNSTQLSQSFYFKQFNFAKSTCLLQFSITLKEIKFRFELSRCMNKSFMISVIGKQMHKILGLTIFLKLNYTVAEFSSGTYLFSVLLHLPISLKNKASYTWVSCVRIKWRFNKFTVSWCANSCLQLILLLIFHVTKADLLMSSETCSFRTEGIFHSNIVRACDFVVSKSRCRNGNWASHRYFWETKRSQTESKDALITTQCSPSVFTSLIDN